MYRIACSAVRETDLADKDRERNLSVDVCRTLLPEGYALTGAKPASTLRRMEAGIELVGARLEGQEQRRGNEDQDAVDSDQRHALQFRADRRRGSFRRIDLADGLQLPPERDMLSVRLGTARRLAKAQRPDPSLAQIKTTDLGHKTYMLEGQGGNILVVIGDDGIIMVDAELAPLHDTIKAAVTENSNLPIKYLVDTHFHGEQTGGNAPFHSDGAIIVAQVGRVGPCVTSIVGPHGDAQLYGR
jgi:hypothetical protein